MHYHRRKLSLTASAVTEEVILFPSLTKNDDALSSLVYLSVLISSTIENIFLSYSALNSVVECSFTR